MIKKIEKIILDALNELNDENEYTSNLIDENIEIFGDEGILDSLGLVALIVEVEQRLSSEENIDIALADEKALSSHRSPFKNLKSLSQYIKSVAKL